MIQAIKICVWEGVREGARDFSVEWPHNNNLSSLFNLKFGRKSKIEIIITDFIVVIFIFGYSMFWGCKQINEVAAEVSLKLKRLRFEIMLDTEPMIVKIAIS